MIDNYIEVTKLIEKMKDALPIDAYPTKRLCSSMKKNNSNIKMKTNDLFAIKSVVYLGDEGGIMCDISCEDSKEALIVSLTHLRIKKLYPFTKEIKSYQINRKKALASNVFKSF